VLALLCAIALLLPGAAPHAQVRLPDLGDTSSEDLSIGAERRYGEQIMREIRRDPAYLDDAVLLEYVQSLWRPLLDASRRLGNIGPETEAQFAFEPFLVNDRSVNAFALPGGHVGIHLGLIAMTATRDELASVLAHELSHVTQRHIARGMANSGRQNMLGMAAMILGMIAASRAGNADMAQAAIAGSQGAVIQGQLNFSRDMEREADRIGFGVFKDAGFAAGGMAAMFEKLDNASRLVDNNAYPYLRSHPLTVERMAEARARTAFAGNTAPESRYLHTLMQARAKVLMDTTAPALQRHLDQVAGQQPFRERLGVLYAAALAASMLRESAAGDKAFAELQRLTANDPRIDTGVPRALALLRAETLLARADATSVAEASRVLAAPEAAGPSRAALLLRADAAYKAHVAGAGSPQALRDSTEALQAWVSEHRADGAAWAALAQTTDALGLRLRSLRAQAEVRAAAGDLSAAIDRLRSAQAASRGAAGVDFIEASVIDARLRELEGQRRQLAAELRGARSGGREEEPRQP
jgi:predicted Zn-dependent protease